MSPATHPPSISFRAHADLRREFIAVGLHHRRHPLILLLRTYESARDPFELRGFPHDFSSRTNGRIGERAMSKKRIGTGFGWGVMPLVFGIALGACSTSSTQPDAPVGRSLGAILEAETGDRITADSFEVSE